VRVESLSDCKKEGGNDVWKRKWLDGCLVVGRKMKVEGWEREETGRLSRESRSCSRIRSA
jgi:hypothetical protein